MQDEKGYVLILTIAIICMMTVSVAVLANRTVFGSALALRRGQTVQALQMAESGALEGYWQLIRNPEFRTAGTGVTKVFNDAVFSGRYTYRIIDNTPTNLQDLELEIVSEGLVGRWQRKVRLRLSRSNNNTAFKKNAWQEEN